MSSLKEMLELLAKQVAKCTDVAVYLCDLLGPTGL
jgi:hypothetical protein